MPRRRDDGAQQWDIDDKIRVHMNLVNLIRIDFCVRARNPAGLLEIGAGRANFDDTNVSLLAGGGETLQKTTV